MTSQSRSSRSKAAATQNTVLRWHTRSFEKPTDALVEEAISSVSGAPVPVVRLESSRGTVEAYFGQQGSLMSWIAMNDEVKISARSDLDEGVILRVLRDFRSSGVQPMPPGGWRDVAWPDDDAPEVQALKQSLSTKVERLREVRESSSEDKYLWVLRATAKHVAEHGMTTLLGDLHDPGQARVKGILTYDFELLVLKLLNQALADG